MQELSDAEGYIAFGLSEDERAVVRAFPRDYFSWEERNAAGHYSYWKGLYPNLGVEEFAEALMAFQEAKELGFQAPRMLALMEQNH